MKNNDNFGKARLNKEIWALFLLASFWIMSISPTVFAQAVIPDAQVKKVTVETEDSILIRVSVPKTIFNRGDNIPINYVVTNNNAKTVYLVIEPRSNVLVENTSVLRLVQPVVGADDHLPFNYDLIKIAPQRTFTGQLAIDSKYYLEDKNYDFSIAGIRVGFSYLFDKSNLGGCKEATYVRPCLKELYDKSKSLTIGNLVVEIRP